MHVALTEAGMTPSSIDSRSPSLPYSHSHTSSPDFDTEPKGGVSFTTCITVWAVIEILKNMYMYVLTAFLVSFL